MARGRRSRDAAVLLPICGALAFMPPLTLIFGQPGDVFGIPREVFYLFSIWLALVIAGAFISRLMRGVRD